jgi:hypothetical protein
MKDVKTSDQGVPYDADVAARTGWDISANPYPNASTDYTLWANKHQETTKLMREEWLDVSELHAQQEAEHAEVQRVAALPVLPKLTIEQDWHDSFLDVEDGGMAKIYHIEYPGEKGVFFKLQSWDEGKEHTEFALFEGKRLRVTVEVIPE